MEHWKLTQWCTRAVSKIRYTPDRRDVYNELRHHINDRCEDFLAQGMSTEEAVNKAVEVMGDPWELAKQLGAIHRPFWGFTLIALRCIVIMLALICLFVIGGLWHNAPDYAKSRWFTETSISDDSWQRQRLYYAEPKLSTPCDDYTLYVQKATLWASESDVFGSCHEIYLFVRITRPPLAPQFNAWDYFWAEDSNGTVYKALGDTSTVDDHSYISSNGRRTGVFSDTGILILRYVPDTEVAWITLHYNRDGRNIALRIDLAGGDAP